MADVDDELESSSSSLTRGDLLKRGAAAAFAVGMFGGLPDRALGFYGPLKHAGKQLSGELSIMTWSHFVPDYEKWLDNTYAKRWGEANDVEVKIAHINNALLYGNGASEVAAQSGHDLSLVHLPAVDVPEAGRSRDRHRPGGVEEARPDDEDRQEEHVQPEDEAVLRLPRDVRARPGSVSA